MTTPQNESASSSQLERSASDLGQQAKKTAGRIADEQISKQKQTATGVLEQVAGALQMTGEHLRGSQQERIARFAEQASDQVRQFSESIRGAQPRDVVRRVEELARREPALFLGGAFLLGLVGARFLKSSERPGNSTRSVPRLPPLERRGADEPYVPGRVGAGSSGGIAQDEDLRAPGDELGGAVREH
ncbi:MAG TPA: hypothetical protein VFI53_10380 [Myxococcaceae bacterium]|nr:hypothetical protein [Myxococcaceae bacterium]